MSKLINGWNNLTLTENGATTFKSTLNPHLDLFAMAGAIRGRDMTSTFATAYAKDRTLATKLLFYLRDIRGRGQGERDTARKFLTWIYTNDLDSFEAIVPLIPFYGRWDDLLLFKGNSAVQRFVRKTFMTDLESANPSLLAKWMPSENASSKDTINNAKFWMRVFNMSAKVYRNHLSTLRRRIDIVERNMSAKRFDKIDYSRVPSNASKLYRGAFKKRDGERYAEYLRNVEKGTAKINAATLYPYEIYKDYPTYGEDATLTAQWNALPNYITDNKSFIVMADVSPSMLSNKGQPLLVSVSLAVYAAERSHGHFAGHYIAYSSHPTLVKIPNGTLGDKFRYVRDKGMGMSTNLVGAFQAILDTALQYNLPQEELPEVVFVISDMEFNHTQNGDTNLEAIRKMFAKANYTMPKLVYWNVDSRQNNVATHATDKDVYLASGFSATTFMNALQMNEKTVTPEDLMLEVLNSERYAKVDEVLY